MGPSWYSAPDHGRHHGAEDRQRDVGVDDRGPREPGPDEHAPSVVRGEGPPKTAASARKPTASAKCVSVVSKGRARHSVRARLYAKTAIPTTMTPAMRGVGQPPEPEPRGEPGHADRDGDQLERRQPLGVDLDARPDGDELRHRADNRETHPPHEEQVRDCDPVEAGTRSRQPRNAEEREGPASDEKRQRDEEVAKRDRGRRARRGREITGNASHVCE